VRAGGRRFVGSIVFAGTSFWMSVLWITVAGERRQRGARPVLDDSAALPERPRGRRGLAFINSIGTMGGFVGPTIIGFLRDHTAGFAVGQITLGGFLLAAALWRGRSNVSTRSSIGKSA
jgi:hypothetical protein